MQLNFWQRLDTSALLMLELLGELRDADPETFYTSGPSRKKNGLTYHEIYVKLAGGWEGIGKKQRAIAKRYLRRGL